MVRKKAWLAIWTMLLGATCVAAQQPMYPQPAYPGYPMPYAQPMPYPMGPYGPPAMAPYGPPAMAPYGQPMAPAMMPYGRPMVPPMPNGPMPYGPVPYGPMPYGPMPYPPQPAPMVLPPAMPPQPPQPANNSPNEPHSVVPTGQPKPPTEVPSSEPALPPEACPVLPEAINSIPGEPYTLYEGRRYRADIKNDCTRMWFQASYIHWWVRSDSTPPLVTTGVNGSFGQLGDPNTALLLGDQSTGAREFNGVQAMFGIWLDDEKLTSFEVGGFWVGNAGRQFTFSSDANGNPILSQPVKTATAEQVLLVTAPGFSSGLINVSTIMDFHGAEVNLARNAYRLNGWSFDYFGGARYLYLNDALSINQNITLLGGSVPFLGVNQGTGANFQFFDSFNARNRFYGGQLGARLNWTYCKWDIGAIMKLGMGFTQHNVSIDGTTTLNSTTTAAGSTLALPSNIGQHSSNDFSFVPELNVTLGYQVTPHIRLMVGYNFLYWTNVVRAANQIDRRVDFTQAPTDPGFVAGKVGSAPQFQNNHTDFWAQGINLGVELKY